MGYITENNKRFKSNNVTKISPMVIIFKKENKIQLNKECRKWNKTINKWNKEK